VTASNVECSIVEVDRVPLEWTVADPSIIDLPTNVVVASRKMIQANVPTVE
jgi:hypothetical protein